MSLLASADEAGAAEEVSAMLSWAAPEGAIKVDLLLSRGAVGISWRSATDEIERFVAESLVDARERLMDRRREWPGLE